MLRTICNVSVLTLSIAVCAAAQDLTTEMVELLDASTDGDVGVYLRQVDGPTLAASQENFTTYPASTIKVLEHLHMLRIVESDPTVDLDSTFLTMCADSRACPGCACPPPALEAGNNCSDVLPDDAASCDSPTVELSLRCTLERMMRPSSNQATNAHQIFAGGGNAVLGRAAMNTTAHDIVGMSTATGLKHKFGCNGEENFPDSNTMTLVDMGVLYEAVATDPAVIVDFTTFRLLMLNESDGLGDTLKDAADEEASSLGMSPSDADVVAFKDGIRLAYKAGNIPFDAENNLYQSLAGWAEFPAGCAEPERQYVFGYFIHQATITNTGGGTIVKELLRDEIRAALETVLCERPPELHCSALLDTLWPPNHKFVDIGFSVDVADACDEELDIRIAVTSDEDPLAAPGAGGPLHCPDALIQADGSILLRAERSRSGDGRVYQVTVTATDSCGSESTCSIQVGVPQNSSQLGAPVDSGQIFAATACN